MAKYGIVRFGLIALVILGTPPMFVGRILAAAAPVSAEVLMVDYQSGQPKEGQSEFCLDAIIVKFDPNTPDTERVRVLETHRCPRSSGLPRAGRPGWR